MHWGCARGKGGRQICAVPVFSSYFIFPLSVSFHHCSILIHSSATRAVWCFSPSTSVFPCQYYSTIAPYSSIHLPPMVYNVFLPVLQFSPVSIIPPLLHSVLRYFISILLFNSPIANYAFKTQTCFLWFSSTGFGLKAITNLNSRIYINSFYGSEISKATRYVLCWY